MRLGTKVQSNSRTQFASNQSKLVPRKLETLDPCLKWASILSLYDDEILVKSIVYTCLILVLKHRYKILSVSTCYKVHSILKDEPYVLKYFSIQKCKVSTMFYAQQGPQTMRMQPEFNLNSCTTLGYHLGQYLYYAK